MLSVSVMLIFTDEGYHLLVVQPCDLESNTETTGAAITQGLRLFLEKEELTFAC